MYSSCDNNAYNNKLQIVQNIWYSWSQQRQVGFFVDNFVVDIFQYNIISMTKSNAFNLIFNYSSLFFITLMYLEEQKLFNCLSQVVIFFKVWLHQCIECCNYCSVCRRLQHSAGARKNRPQGGNLFSINRTTMFPNLRHYDKKHKLLHISKIDPTSEGLKMRRTYCFLLL